MGSGSSPRHARTHGRGYSHTTGAFDEAVALGIDFQSCAVGDAGDGERQNVTAIDVKRLIAVVPGFDQPTTNRQDRRG